MRRWMSSLAHNKTFFHAASLVAVGLLTFNGLHESVCLGAAEKDAKVELGKKLFFDPRLSIDGTISCSSCHNITASGEDNRPNSVGVGGQKGGRTAPTVFNAGKYSVLFWDGRANTLEDQARGPMTNPIEMGMPNHGLVVKRLKKIKGYVNEFHTVFGEDKAVEKDKAVTIENTVEAIAAFERTLVTTNSPYDRYLAGDKTAISDDAKAGLALVNKFGCTSCHSGKHFSGSDGLESGTGNFQKFPLVAGTKYEEQYKLKEDLGRFTHTGKEFDKNRWRVSTWLNVAITAPYFHNGAVKTLDEAVRVMAATQLKRTLDDDQTKQIVAFLTTLTGELPEITLPRLPATEGFELISADEKKKLKNKKKKN